MQRRIRWISLFTLLFASLYGTLEAQTAAKQTFMVAMRDGVRLATDVYLPAGSGKFPVVLLRNPYNKDGGDALGRDGAKRGYAMVIQDTRGRFASEGANLPFGADGWWGGHQDGYDTLDWLVAQGWCNGKIGTFGGSALGITQIALAGTGHPNLVAQHISVAAPSMYEHLIFPGGVFKKAMIEDWLKATQHAPESLAQWTSHPTHDAYWKERDLTRRWKMANAPAVHIGGWYDIFAQGTLDAFNGYQTRGGKKARGKQILIMGPWTHGIFQDKAGERTFPNGKTPPNSLHDQWGWFDFHLKGERNRFADAPAVAYYVMGDASDPQAPGNVWRTAKAWPPFPTKPLNLYLGEGKTLSQTPSDRAATLSYRYDPADPTPTVGGTQLTLPAGAMEQSKVENRPDVVTFSTPPLAEPVEVTGRVRMTLWASSDRPDTDFVVKLCDVTPDGRSYNICEGLIRARFRDSLEREKPLKAGKATRFRIDLWSTSVIFNKGHRIRVQIASASSPGYDPNPNTGKPFRADSERIPATNTLHFGGAFTSHIELPVPKEQSILLGKP